MRVNAPMVNERESRSAQPTEGYIRGTIVTWRIEAPS
jgi:hypothetical protein